MKQRDAFTLVELSIVLVIIGLIVGGVMVGTSLIRGGELRAVTSEYQRYISGINAFRDKYFFLPGDITNATSLWGTDSDGCPGTNAAITYTQGTCNGDGSGTWSASASSSNELFRAWQQMAYGNFIEGVYSGIADSTTGTDAFSKIGTNVPASKLSSAGWSLNNLGVVAISSTTYFEGTYNNVMIFGRQTASDLTTAAAITGADAFDIDTKLDDGKPGSGNITTFENASNCHGAGTSNAAALAGTASYTRNSSTTGCMLIFKTNTY